MLIAFIYEKTAHPVLYRI